MHLTQWELVAREAYVATEGFELRVLEFASGGVDVGLLALASHGVGTDAHVLIAESPAGLLKLLPALLDVGSHFLEQGVCELFLYGCLRLSEVFPAPFGTSLCPIFRAESLLSVVVCGVKKTGLAQFTLFGFDFVNAEVIGHGLELVEFGLL